MPIKFVLSACFLSLVAAAPASAITFNFITLADDIESTSGFERNWNDVSGSGGTTSLGTFAGQTFTKRGLGVSATGSAGNGGFAVAFLDSSTRLGPAGLGVCSTGPGSGLMSGCATDWGRDPADDNVSGAKGGETLSLNFTNRITVSKITFRDSIHRPLATGSIRIAGNDIAILNGQFADPADYSLLDGLQDVDFAYTGDEFYLSKVVVAPIPLPATLPLALAAFGAFGLMARKRRRS